VPNLLYIEALITEKFEVEVTIIRAGKGEIKVHYQIMRPYVRYFKKVDAEDCTYNCLTN